MARIDKDSSRRASSPAEDDFMNEMIENELSGCEMSRILMEMLEMAITKQNPFQVSLNSENEDRLLGLYGYELTEFPVKEEGGKIGYYEGAVKLGENVPKKALTKSQFVKYSKKSILDRENQMLVLKIMAWLISKFNGNDSSKSGNTEEA